MALGGLSSDFSRTIEQLRVICSDADPEELLMLAAGQHCLNVKFHYLLQDPESHTFMCFVEVGNLLENQECVGYGPTKKDAKMNAAQEAIEEITNRLKDLLSSPSISETSSSKSSEVPSQNISRINPYSPRSKTEKPNSSSSGQIFSQLSETLFPEQQSSPLHQRPAMFSPVRIMGAAIQQHNNNNNPIGELQELADGHGWPKPTYEEVDEYGEDHRKTFVVQCMFRDMTTEGICTTKKSAKRKSAEEMLKKIAQSGNNRLKKPTTSLFSTPMASKDIHSKRSMPAALLARSVQKEKLEKLASKKGWTVEWHDLGKGLKENSLCFVRVKTALASSPTVCSGSGIGNELARDEAARNALEILERI